VLDERLLQVGLRVFIFEVEKFVDERVLDDLFRCYCVARFGSLSLLKHGSFIL
jgi:hypothetical protein